MKIRVLIVDDEPLARERIRTLLAAEADLDLIGECASGPEAVKQIRQLAPDLVFLDIQMPGMDGFEVLRALGSERLPLVIFATAYDQHAIRAFEVHALDYLLKPFKQVRLKETLQRAREAIAARDTSAATRKLMEMLSGSQPPSKLAEHLSRISVRTGERVVLVRVEQVDYIESAGNYVLLHVGKESHVLRETLTSLEEQLNPKQFLRISRSILVNVDQIKELQPLFKGDHAVLLHNGKQLTMTRGIREVQELLRFS